MEETLIERLRNRARTLLTKHPQSCIAGLPDRLSDLLEEAADELQKHEDKVKRYKQLLNGDFI
jgi:phage shock protein A